MLALVLYALSTCDDQHAGFDPYLFPCSPLPAVNVKDRKSHRHWQEVIGFTFRFLDSPIYPGPRQYRIKGTLFASRGLIGRGTMVYRVASLEDNLKEDAVEDEALKICWPHRNRKLEGDTLECLRKRLPAQWHDHIPEVTYSATATAEDLRLPRVELLKLSAIKDFERKDRQLHILVMKIYKKLWEAGSVEEFMEIYLDCVECHHASYTKGRVLHRDLSENNLMFKTASDGPKKGILNDWDLASEVEDDNEIRVSNANHRTGTLPFMARDLLVNDPPLHLYRHDLESFFYILIWAALHYDFAAGTKISSDQVSITRTWNDDVFRRNRSAKNDFLKERKRLDEVIASARKGCEPLIPWITSIWRLFFIAERAEPIDGYDNEVAVEWDNVTLGGHLTFETFMKALGRKPRDDLEPLIRTSEISIHTH
ncbi:hypothetical protein H0H87_010365 [Tephrocybe sp. NHM501043]|nr:hypothetical protein H0H87_010365 [Tephrocybe sp. NHM501043]